MPWPWSKPKKISAKPVPAPAPAPTPPPATPPPPKAGEVSIVVHIPEGQPKRARRMTVTVPGRQPYVFWWRDDSFMTENDVKMFCSGFDIGDHRDHGAVPGCFIFQLAGGTHRSQVLSRKCFDPGKPVLLVREPTNKVDPNAIAIWDVDRDSQAGYVPAKLTKRIGDGMGDTLTGLILLDWRRGRQRVSLTILVGGDA